MNKILALLSLAVVFGLFATSCLDEKENRQEITLNYSGELCFNRVFDRETGNTLITLNPSYEFTYDLIGQTVNITMSGIQLAEGFGGLSFKLPKLSYKITDKSPFYITEGTDIVPMNVGQGYVFNKFRLQALPGRYIDNVNCPVYLMEFTVNDRYEVTVFPTNPILVGSSTALRTDDSSQSRYTKENCIVSISIEPQKMTAKITALKSEFSAGMPETSLAFADVPVEIFATGMRFHTEPGTEHKVLNTNNSQMNTCTYTDLDFAYSLNGTSTASYSIDLTSKSDSYHTFGIYDVSMQLGYLFTVK